MPDPPPGWAAGPSTCREWLRDHVAQLLEVPLSDVSATEDLIDQGLDSVRLMTLVERLRTDGADVDFVDLAEHVTLEQWVDVVLSRAPTLSLDRELP